MKTFLCIIFVIVFCTAPSFSQHQFRCVVRDSTDDQPLIGVFITLKGTVNGTVTDVNGKAQLKNIPAGVQTIVFSSVGHRTVTVRDQFPSEDSLNERAIMMAQDNVQLDEVTVSSTRTNARIEDLPQKVEVLGIEEMDEESSVVPGSIGSILGDIAVITVQRTNPVNGNDAIRMEGLDPQYTQLMRDGFPLYGGFSGSLGVLSIPPLDLKQVEIIKGSVSTLYGGGAIAGLINFISKTPAESLQTTLLLNRTTLNETNIDAFLSGRNEDLGFTFFAAGALKPYSDVNHDGFTEVPVNNSYTVHPRLFMYLSPETELIFGGTFSFDERSGGDNVAVENGSSTAHPFIQKEKAHRNTFDLQFSTSAVRGHLFTVRSAAGVFAREISLSGFHFSGRQYSTYSEASDLLSFDRHTIVAGVNVVTEAFRKNGPDTLHIPEQTDLTAGFFLQDGWQLTSEVMLETGVRFDHTERHGNMLLPRIAAVVKPDEQWTIRFSGGMGYKTPSILSLTDPSPALYIDPSQLSSERSYGFNTDINHRMIIFDDINIELNQAFYFTKITDPLTIETDSLGRTSLRTGAFTVSSYGSDTYIRATVGVWELYLGYNHTEALQHAGGIGVPVPFNPKDKMSITIAVTPNDVWRTGIETSFTGNQYIAGGIRVPDFWFFAAMVERKFGFGSIVLNAENLFDSRQSKHEALVTGTAASPVFTPLWGPVEGRVVNLSIKTIL